MSHPATAEGYRLQAQAYLAKQTPEDNQMALGCFKNALTIDPQHALAYVGLSLAFSQRTRNLGLGSTWLEDATSAAEMAIALDDSLGEAYEALLIACHARLRLRKELETRRRLTELNPTDGAALRELGWQLWFMGHPDEAIAPIKKGLELDPSSHWAYFFLGNASLALELYDEAEYAYRRGIELKPNFSSGHIGLICTYVAQGKLELAIRQRNNFREHLDDDRIFVKLADAELLLGDFREAGESAREGVTKEPEERYWPRGILASTILGFLLADRNGAESKKFLEQSEDLDRARMSDGDESYMPRFDLAIVRGLQGDKAEARQWLQDAINRGWRGQQLAARDPLVKSLHEDQIVLQMLAQLKVKASKARQTIG